MTQYIHTNCDTKNTHKLHIKPTSGVFVPGLHLQGHRWLVCECPFASQSYGHLTGRPLCEWTPQSWCLGWLCRPWLLWDAVYSEPPHSHPIIRKRKDSHHLVSNTIYCSVSLVWTTKVFLGEFCHDDETVWPILLANLITDLSYQCIVSLESKLTRKQVLLRFYWFRYRYWYSLSVHFSVLLLHVNENSA